MERLNGLDIYIYLRKSRKDIEEEKKAIASGTSFNTLDRHRRRLMEVVKNEAHNVVEVFEEIVSGEYIIERPEIQRMLREVDNGSVDAVLVVDLDRLGRGDMFDMGAIFRTLQYSETCVLTPTDMIDPNSEGAELLFGVKSIISREELKQINRRLQGGRRDSAKEGKSISKNPPYGYLRDKNLKLYADPDKSWVVEKIFQMIIGGFGRSQISNELYKLNIPSPSGQEAWNVSSVSEVVKNEVYIGSLIWGRFKHLKRNGEYKRKKVTRDKWIIHENAHEPLVSKDIFEQANKIMTGRYRPSTTTTKKLANPLAGILKCHLCGHTMQYQPRPDRPNDYIRCFRVECKSKQKGAVLELVEGAVLDGLREIVDQTEFKTSRKQNGHSLLPVKKTALESKEKELIDMHTQKEKLHDLLEKGIYDESTFLERFKVLSDKIKEIKQIVDKLSEEVKEEELKRTNIVQFLPQVRKVLSIYDTTESIEKKNQLLKSVIEKVIYQRDPEWNKKDQFELNIYPRV